MIIQLEDKVQTKIKGIEYSGIVLAKDSEDECIAFLFDSDINIISNMLALTFDDILLDNWRCHGYYIAPNPERFLGKKYIWRDKDKVKFIQSSNLNIISVQEKPCQVCNRMNDLGKTVCWWCLNIP